MPHIPPLGSSDPFGDLNSRFRLRAHSQTEPLRHGLTPHAMQEDQWVESLDRQARLQAMPGHYVFINHLLVQGVEPEEVCARLNVSMEDVREAQAWFREGPPPASGSVDITL